MDGASAGGAEYSPRILFMDKAAAVCELGVRVLSQDGYGVTPAATADEALLALRTKTFQLLVLDLNFPDGIEILRRIRSEFPQLKVLATACFKAEVRADAIIAAGATAILEKPITVRRLRNAVYRALDPECGWLGRRTR